MKTTKAQQNGNRWKAKAWILAHPIFGYDAERVAAEDKLDADWREAVRQARAKVSADWAGDPNDDVGKLRAAKRPSRRGLRVLRSVNANATAAACPGI